MVKIRYAALRETTARDVINIALLRTTVKFDNNIIANRFDQVGSHYEVTIKCVSSRGKGAKRGATGRRTTSCCWHAWDTFFEELFRLNPEIVIVSNGSRVTSQSHVGWRDNEPEVQCDCEPVIQESEATSFEESPARTTVNINSYEPCRSCTFNVGMRCVFGDGSERPLGCPFAPTPEPTRRCNASCRHNSANTGRTCPVHIPCDCDLSGWEPHVPPTVNRSCATCRYSMGNTLSRGSECPPGRCLQEEGLQHWELYTPASIHLTPPGVHRHCVTCRHSITHNPGRFCTLTTNCTERAGFQLWEQFVEPGEPIVEVRCANCIHSIEHNGRNEYCGLTCHNKSHFEPYNQPPPACVDCAYSRDRRSTVECPHNANEVCLVDNRHRNFVRWVDDPTPSNQRACCDCKYSAGNNGGESCDCAVRCLIGSEHRLFVKYVARTTTVTRECNTCKYSYSHNNDIPCFNVVGACGSGNPKWVQWIPDIDMEGLNPELYMQQPTVMPEEKGYMDFEGVM